MCALLPILPKIDMQANKKMCRYRYVYILSAKIGETAELTIFVYILHGYIQCHSFLYSLMTALILLMHYELFMGVYADGFH